MERDYVVSDERTVRVDEDRDLVAVRGRFDSSWGTVVSPCRVAPMLHEAQAYECAGWVFVRPSADLVGAIEGGNLPPQASAFGRVYRYRDRVLLGTQEIYVQLAAELSQSVAVRWLEERGLQVVRPGATGHNVFVVAVGARDPFDVAHELRQAADRVEFADPSLLEVLEQRSAPDDTYFPYQWNLERIGAESAWLISRGNRVKVAIVDTDFDKTHEDLAGAIAADSGTRRSDGTWVYSLKNPSCNHGTRCAGVVGARGWNGKGLVGVAPHSSLKLVAIESICCKLIDTNAIAEAFAHALRARPPRVKRGADVISCSVATGLSILTNPMKKSLRACAEGRDKLGVPVFWAVGNDPSRVVADDEIAYSKHVIAVGRSNKDGTAGPHASGPGLELLAPGELIITTADHNSYSATSLGTSFAAPCAAGVAALVIAANPGLPAEHVRLLLRATCAKIGSVTYTGLLGWNPVHGYGRVNAAAAVWIADWLRSLGWP